MILKVFIKINLMVICFGLICSCGTLVHSSSSITITTIPPKVDVYYGDEYLGVTPLVINLDGRYMCNLKNITLKKMNYQTQTRVIATRFNQNSLLNILNLGTLLPVDIITGNICEITPLTFNYNSMSADMRPLNSDADKELKMLRKSKGITSSYLQKY